MGKKKQDMSQIYNNSGNEFVFGVNGGRGKHLSSFLKNLSLTGGSSSNKTEDFNTVNGNIYGNMSYTNSGNDSTSITSGKILPSQRSVSMGSSHPRNSSDIDPKIQRSSSYMNSNHSDKVVSSSKNYRASSSKRWYADSDDDWNADLEDMSAVSNKQPENKSLSKLSSNDVLNSPSRTSMNLQNGHMLDSLYPDLTVPVATVESGTPYDSDRHSMDKADYQTKSEIARLNLLNSRFSKFQSILKENNINIQNLRKLSWNGIPSELRAFTWQILLGYLPTNKSRQKSTLKRKRQEYTDGLSSIMLDFHENAPKNGSNTSLSNSSNNSREKALYHQINIDVKRTHPSIKMYSHPVVQESLRKILYLWAVRHPASGYVQGINDLCTPFFQTFLHNYIWQLQTKDEDDQLSIPGMLDDEDEKEASLLQDPNLKNYNLENFDLNKISTRAMCQIEADTYWCLSRLLENITDNYIHEQPGIVRQVSELRNLISKIDIELIQHFDKEGIEFIQFAFRWMNCLLMREISLDLIIRMWDTYLSECPLGFNNFHVYVCAAFLVKFSDELKEKDFQEILLFLQNPPTARWKEKEVELILSEAFIWQSLYKNASAHLR